MTDSSCSDTETVPLRKCSRCQESKPPGEFYRNRTNAQGLDTYCKSCRKTQANAWRRDATPEALAKIRERQKAWNRVHPDRLRELQKKWWASLTQEQKARHKERRRSWKKANPEKVREQNRRAWERKKALKQQEIEACTVKPRQRRRKSTAST